MSVTLDLPSDLETVLQKKAQNEGLTISDFLLRLATREAEGGAYSTEEIQGFLDADRLTPDLLVKVQSLLGK